MAARCGSARERSDAYAPAENGNFTDGRAPATGPQTARRACDSYVLPIAFPSPQETAKPGTKARGRLCGTRRFEQTRQYGAPSSCRAAILAEHEDVKFRSPARSCSTERWASHGGSGATVSRSWGPHTGPFLAAQIFRGRVERSRAAAILICCFTSSGVVPRIIATFLQNALNS